MANDWGSGAQGRRWFLGYGFAAALVLGICLMAPRALSGQEALRQLRDDVRSESGDVTISTPSQPERRGTSSGEDPALDEGWPVEILIVPAAVVTSPFWLPHTALGDDFALSRSFAQYPYQSDDGYYVTGTLTPPAETSLGALDRGLRRLLPSRGPCDLAGRLQVDWGGDLDDLECLDGHLLLSTASRFGLDTQAGYFREAVGSGRHDQLWLGDGNLVFRFAQSDVVEFRTGVGLNWLADRDRSNLGVNFTYGFDLYPVRPWVLSTELDWGTLGSAELFRFRGTLGVIVHGVEVFTGYEYLDIDRLHQNSLLAGLRLWF